MHETFFKWLDSIGKLDRYESLLDYEDDYTNQLLNISAKKELYELRKMYNLHKLQIHRKLKLEKIKNVISKR